MGIWQKMCLAGAEMIRAGGGQTHCRGNAERPQGPAQAPRLKTPEFAMNRRQSLDPKAPDPCFRCLCTMPDTPLHDVWEFVRDIRSYAPHHSGLILSG